MITEAGIARSFKNNVEQTTLMEVMDRVRSNSGAEVEDVTSAAEERRNAVSVTGMEKTSLVPRKRKSPMSSGESTEMGSEGGDGDVTNDSLSPELQSSEHGGEEEEEVAAAAAAMEAENDQWKISLRLRNMYKLFTREDKQNIHKILGLFCLVHYVFRFLSILLTGTMNFENTNRVSLTVLLAAHALLSFSSFIFHIPSKRHRGKPMIWKELRLHNCIFASRSLLDMMIHTYNLGDFQHGVLRFTLTLVTMYLADKVTDHYKRLDLLEKNDTTMRKMPWPKATPETIIAGMNYYYGLSQLFATLGVLNISRHWETDMELAFTTLFAIQISALLLTLVRKSIIEAFAWHFWYGVSLGLSWVLAVYRYSSGEDFSRNLMKFVAIYPLLTVSLSLFRFKFTVNKYLLWTGFYLFDALVLSKGYKQHPFEPLF